MFIVGFTGRAGSGKDTAGSVLTSRFGFERFAFADPIKAAISAMFYWPLENWADREWKEQPALTVDGLGLSPRFLAQTLGTEWGRTVVHPDFWVRVTESRIAQSGADRVVITDVRFDNEARWIQSRGGLVIEIFRDEAVAVNEHVSEQGIHPRLIDFSIMNHGSKRDFENHVFGEIHAKLLAVDSI